MTKRIDVFISYKREERALSELVKRALISAGYTAVSDLNIGKNEEFGDAIDTMIRTATLTLVLWTRASAASDWVRKEARLARDLEKGGKGNRYLGVMVEDVDLDLPPDLRGLQMVNVQEAGLNGQGIERVLASASEILGEEAKKNAASAEADSTALTEEWQLYDLARSINVAAAYKRYLARYPNGEFVDDAYRQLGMFRWYLHPFRQGNLSNTLAAVGIAGTIGATVWGATRNVADTDVIGVEPSVHAAIIAERDTAISEAESMRSQITDAESQTEAIVATHQAELDGLAQEVERLENELAASEASRGALASENQSLVAQIANTPSSESSEQCRQLADQCIDLTETRIDLSGSNFTDVSQLSDFENLTWLNLTNSAVSEIDNFPNLQNLEVLFLGGPQVADVSSLSHLRSLRLLYLWQTNVDDLSSLADLPRLQFILMPDGSSAGSQYSNGSATLWTVVQRAVENWRP